MRYVFGVSLIFMSVFTMDFAIHGLLLKGAYEATATVWRTPSEMMDMMKFMAAGQALFSVAFCGLFMKVSVKSPHVIRLGVSYGFWLGMMFVSSNLIWYSVLPVPVSLAIKWCVLAFLQAVILGLIIGVVASVGRKAKLTTQG